MFKEAIKLTIFENKKIIIRNYLKLNEIRKNLLSIDEYEIYGDFLQIMVLDEEYIEIHGCIKEIKILA